MSADDTARDRPDSGQESTAGRGDDARNFAADDTDFYRLRNIGAVASRVVTQAASVLEEEIAAGIVAAEQIERRFIDLERVRGEDPSVVMQRFRKDAHDIVDILMDLLSVAVNSATGLASQAIRLRAAGEQRPSRGAADKPPTGVPTLKLPGTVAPGNATSTQMSIDNDADEPLEAFGFTVTDLLGTPDLRIAADHVRLDPPTVTVAPRSSQRVTVEVQVPPDAAPAVYSGLLQSTRLSAVRAVLVVTVGPADESAEAA